MPTVESIHDELTRRHRAAVIAIAGVFGFTLLLATLAFAGVKFTLSSSLFSPTLDVALRIAIVVFGLGAVALRRTKFAALRLQDIAALEGASGLLITLQKTTVRVALLGGIIAIMGFIIAMIPGNGPKDMLYIGLITVAILLYCYPRHSAWERVVQTTQSPGEPNTPAVKGKIA